MDKPIPAFYACYLLRSTIRHASLYVGSTPNPVRRLRQHNGDAKGGAAKTSRDSLRPWEMTCLVTGFPSKVAALQFEWAWQNTHLTRHISPNSRLAQTQRTVRFSPKTGRVRKRAARPRLSLTDRLANLHQLLQASSFERLPLVVTFYAEDVFRVWQKWTTLEPQKLQSRVRVTMDSSLQNPVSNAENISTGANGIHAIDVGYKGLKLHLEKSRSCLSNPPPCIVCYERLHPDSATSIVCPKDDCSAVGHLNCFATLFLEGEDNSLIPREGSCPGCGSTLQWIDLVKELSLRMRAPKDVDKLLKAKKSSRTKTADQDQTISDTNEELSNEEDGAIQHDEPMEDEWHFLSDSSETEFDVTTMQGDANLRLKRPGGVFSASASRPEPLIEDSDWDDAEIVI